MNSPWVGVRPDWQEWAVANATWMVACARDGSLGRHVTGIQYRHTRSHLVIEEVLYPKVPGRVTLKFGERLQEFDSPEAAWAHVCALVELQR